MRTNIELDDDVVRRAMKLTGAKSKREVVDLALRSLVEQHERRDLRDLAGKIHFRRGYDPHATRTR